MKPNYVEHKDRATRIKSAITAIEAILPLKLYPAHKKKLLRVCIWKITEADGKSKVRYWSEGAVENQSSKLQHEHVHEIKELVARLMSGESVKAVVSDAVACMVTKEEHINLGGSSKLGWDRYKDSRIRVYDAKGKQWCW
jgi:hypothetical protein